MAHSICLENVFDIRQQEIFAFVFPDHLNRFFFDKALIRGDGLFERIKALTQVLRNGTTAA